MSTLVKCVCLRLIPASRIFTFHCADRELIAERWEAGAGTLSAGRVNGLWADEILSLSVLPGIRPPCPIFPLFIPLTPRTLGFNFPWVFTTCHCLHSEFRTGMKFGEITYFLLLLLLLNFGFTESERLVIARQHDSDFLRVWIGSRGLGGRVHLVFLQLQEPFDVRWHQMAQSGGDFCLFQTKKAAPSLVTVSRQLSRPGKTIL